MDDPLVSVVVTVKNEEANIRYLLDSMVVQEPPLEVLMVDAASTDDTPSIIKGYSKRYPFVKLMSYDAQRGESRNAGIKAVHGKYVAFTDGDCIANPFWIKEIRRSLAENDIVGGQTITMGYEPMRNLGRMEVYHKGQDITFPSCNLAYRRDVLIEIGGFDRKFVTAEDVDMNFRAVNRGHSITYNPDMIIYHKERSTVLGFIKQAFWNGFGRKQLTVKHGSLWGNYRAREMLEKPIGFWWMLRTTVAMMGYFSYYMAHSRYRIDATAGP
jgi:glycosyltransferase involved in cell wall biosynthesis